MISNGCKERTKRWEKSKSRYLACQLLLYTFNVLSFNMILFVLIDYLKYFCIFRVLPRVLYIENLARLYDIANDIEFGRIQCEIWSIRLDQDGVGEFVVCLNQLVVIEFVNAVKVNVYVLKINCKQRLNACAYVYSRK